jgi:glycosyltransferase involved in cell wall biosynthesis
MRIGIDARMLGPQCGGLGRYVEQLVLGIEQIDRENAYVVFLRKDNWERYAPAQPNFQKALVDIPWYGIAEQFRLPKILKKAGVDIMHFPHWNVPLAYRKPFVVTIHDLIMWHYPRKKASTHGPMVYWLKDFVARAVLRSAARRARHILTTSEFTKQDIHETLGIRKEKMTVAYQAPFNDISTYRNIDISKYLVVKPYVLYVGSAYPHKNLARLIDAWRIVEEKTNGAYQLVLAGKDGFFYKKLSRYIDISRSRNIVLTGFVEDDVLDALYREASLSVAPSLYEGYALPALEAIQSGIPVAASNRTCFPEVLGEAALYFDPENTAQMASVIIRALKDDTVRFDLLSRGKEELKRYSSEAQATRTRAMYEAERP